MIKLKEKGRHWSTWQNQQRLEELLKVGKEYVETVAHDAWNVQEVYDNYSLLVYCAMCSDGRVNLAKCGECFEGEVFPYRSIGGIFHYGESAFKKEFNEAVAYAKELNKTLLFFITFHYDDDPEKCCAGWRNNTEKAKKNAFRLRDQIRRVFAGGVCPIVVGIKTSSEELTIFDEIPERFISCSELIGFQDAVIYEKIQLVMGRFIPQNVKKYLLRLIKGNISHIEKCRKTQDKISVHLHHHEIAICFGKMFQWFPPHRGIIINPSLNSLKEILQAVDIQARNEEMGRVKNGCLLVVCTPYRDVSKIPAATEQTRDLTHFALKHIYSHRPDFHERLSVLSVIINIETKELTLVDMDPVTLEFKPLEPVAYDEVRPGEQIVFVN